MTKTILILAIAAALVAGASITFAIQDNTAVAAKPTSYLNFDAVFVQPGDTNTATVTCRPGDIATGGGFAIDSSDLTILSSHTSLSTPAPINWSTTAQNNGISIHIVTSYVVCAP